MPGDSESCETDSRWRCENNPGVKLSLDARRGDMDESGERHPQQTDTRTENETPHILTHRQVMKNENTWTQRGEY
ncbi:uncharacterized protein LOC144580946 isoform X3 [Callithrix jacchus]